MTLNKPVFLGHGSPGNAIADNRFSRFLRAYAASIPKPRAVVVVSAHWVTEGSFITSSSKPKQIYDFYGFPGELYELEYAPRGSPEVAKEIAAGIGAISVDRDRGIDHAAWALLVHMYPERDVPLLELSLDARLSERGHFELGRDLARFAGEVLFIGSGNLVHNLGEVSFQEGAVPFPWALEADAWMKEKTEGGLTGDLIDYKSALPRWRRPIPTDEHYLPLLYVAGMAGEGRPMKTLYEEIQNGSVSMRCVEAGA